MENLLNKVKIEILSDGQDWYEELFCKYIIDPILEYRNYQEDNLTREQLIELALKLNLPIKLEDDRLFFYADQEEVLLAILASDDPDIKI